MGGQFAAQDVRLLAEPGAGLDPAGVFGFRGGALSIRYAALAGLSRRADSAGRDCRRGAGRCATEGVPRKSRQQGPGLRCRPVALVAPSELLLRMAWLAGLSRDRALDRFPLGLGDAAGAVLHVLDPGLRHRHPAAGRADAAFARRPLPRLPVAHQRLLPVTAARMIPQSGDRFSLATNAKRVCAEIMLKMKGATT